jgi:hypothetical protein
MPLICLGGTIKNLQTVDKGSDAMRILLRTISLMKLSATKLMK